MTGKASCDEVAEHALNRDIDFRDEIDGAFFSTSMSRWPKRSICSARRVSRLDGRVEESGGQSLRPERAVGGVGGGFNRLTIGFPFRLRARAAVRRRP
jgi:hypothetical protein